MELFSTLQVIIGGLMIFAGGIWFLVECFRENIWWGLGCLLFSPAQLIFLIIYWDRAAKPFGVQILGAVLMFFGTFVSESGMN